MNRITYTYFFPKSFTLAGFFKLYTFLTYFRNLYQWEILSINSTEKPIKENLLLTLITARSPDFKGMDLKFLKTSSSPYLHNHQTYQSEWFNGLTVFPWRDPTRSVFLPQLVQASLVWAAWLSLLLCGEFQFYLPFSPTVWSQEVLCNFEGFLKKIVTKCFNNSTVLTIAVIYSLL